MLLRILRRIMCIGICVLSVDDALKAERNGHIYD